ncbi:hypothetical protein ACOSP7_014322 [Xanthoceras sorbifolium]
MSESILAKVVGLTTSHKVWTKLEIVFANQMKGSMSIDEYLTKMKGLVDQIEVTGQLIQDSKLITIGLVGLDREYDSVVSLITHQVTVIDWFEVEAILMTQEIHIKRLNTMNEITANVATNHSSTNGKPYDHGTNFNNIGQSGGNPRLFKDAILSSQQGFRDPQQLYPLSVASSPSSHIPLLSTIELTPTDHAPAAAAPPPSLSHDHAIVNASLFFNHAPAGSYESTPAPAVSPFPKLAAVSPEFPLTAVSALPKPATVSPESTPTAG